MTTTLILVFSLVAMLQFFISYCRSVIASSVARPLSEQVREASGIQGREARGEEFVRLLQLASLCPASGTDHTAIAAIRAYFRMVTWARAGLQRVIPGVVLWAEAELAKCAHFAAVALDRRIAHSHDLMSKQFCSHS